MLAVDEVALHLAVVVSACLRERLEDTLVSVLQVVLAHEADVDNLRGLVAAIQEVAPRAQPRRFANGHVELAQNRCVELLLLHAEGHLVNRGLVDALHHCVGRHVAKVGHLLAQAGREFVLGAEHEDVGLNTEALQLLDGVLRGLRFQFAGGGEIGHVSEVHAHGISAQFPFKLANGLEEGQAFDVAHRAADFRNHKVVVVFLAEIEHVALNLVSDVRDYLNGLAEVVAAAFFLDDALVDAPRGDVVVARSLNARKAFVVTEVEVGFLPVVGNVALAVLVRVKRPRVNINVGVELLNGNVETSGLQQFADRR